MTTRLPVLVIGGPTAAGKSALAMAVGEALDGELISADSRQLFRGLDIGTAKPTPAERARVPHHLIDVLDPQERWTVADFQQAALGAIEAVHARGRLPILVGGTGFYIQAVVDGLSLTRVAPDEELRRHLKARAAEEGPLALHGELARLDPVTAGRLHPNDLFRVVRALEVTLSLGRPMSEAVERQAPPYAFTLLGVAGEREALYDRIDQRVHAMLRAGWLRETEAHLAAWGADHPLLRTLGYHELVQHLAGAWGIDEAIALIQRHTRRYAKRQLTWFRAEKRLEWFDPGGCDTISQVLSFVQGRLTRLSE